MRPGLIPLLTLASMMLLASACKREERQFHTLAPSSTVEAGLRLPTIQPGAPIPEQHALNLYDDNAWAMSQGQTLFSAFNCVGCHAHGGGGMGPPLMDDKWIYGSEPEQIYATIMEGRPNGMPSFRGKIPENQVWELVAYVRSLSGLTSPTASPGRPDEMRYATPPNSTATKKPTKSPGIPKSGEMPQ